MPSITLSATQYQALLAKQKALKAVPGAATQPKPTSPAPESTGTLGGAPPQLGGQPTTPPAPVQSKPADFSSGALYDNSIGGGPGITNALIRSAYGVISQPAKAQQQVGTGIGEHLAEAIPRSKTELAIEKWIDSKIGITKENAPAIKAAFEGGVKPSDSVESAVGSEVQAAANLATPLTLESGALGFGLQGAALGAGKAMEEDKGIGSVALQGAVGGVVSAAVGGATEFAGNLVGKGLASAKSAITDTLKPWLEKMAPAALNMTKKEIATMTGDMAPKVAENLSIIKDAPSTEEGLATLKEKTLTKLQSVYGAAKKVAQDTYAAAKDNILQKFGGQQGSREGILGAFQQILKEGRADVSSTFKKVAGSYKEDFTVATPNPADQGILQNLWNTMKEHEDFSTQGLFDLKAKIGQYVDSAEQGSTSERTAYLMWDEVDKELSRVTKGATDTMNSSYKAFKDAANNVKPLWRQGITEDSARNFVNNIMNAAKGGSLSALKKLEAMAGQEGEGVAEVQASKFAQKVMGRIGQKATTKLATTGALVAGGSAIGGAIAGPNGAKIGAALGSLAGGALVSPEIITNAILKQVEDQGATVASSAISKLIAEPTVENFMSLFKGKARAIIGNIISDPAFMNAIAKPASQAAGEFVSNAVFPQDDPNNQ